MNTKKAADRWHCNINTVRSYCNSGIIPDAYKKGVWVIPDNQQKPPTGRASMVKVLEYIKTCRAYPDNQFAHPLSEKQFWEIVLYLEKYGFISKITVMPIKDVDWSKMAVSQLGENLIKEEQKGMFDGAKVSVTAGVSDTGIKTIGLSIEKK